MAQGHHVVGALRLGGVHGLLYGLIEVLALVALGEAVDILAPGILEIGGGGLGKGLRCVNTHIGHLGIAVGDQLVGVKDRLVGGQVHEVAADIGVLGLVLGQGEEVVHAVVELMVAGDGDVIAGLVHDIDDVGALGEGADGAALDGVTGVHQGDVILAIEVLHLRLQGGDAGIADGAYGVVFLDRLVNAAMHVVQNDDAAGGGSLRPRGRSGHEHGQDHDSRQEQG